MKKKRKKGRNKERKPAVVCNKDMFSRKSV
jgi:hypothetical protein